MIKINHKKNKLYPRWKNMNSRCNNPSNRDYPRYGAMGAVVCEEWSDNNPNGLVNFIEWYEEKLKVTKGRNLVVTFKDQEKMVYSPDTVALVTRSQSCEMVGATVLPEEKVIELRKLAVNHKGTISSLCRKIGLKAGAGVISDALRGVTYQYLNDTVPPVKPFIPNHPVYDKTPSPFSSPFAKRKTSSVDSVVDHSESE